MIHKNNFRRFYLISTLFRIGIRDYTKLILYSDSSLTFFCHQNHESEMAPESYRKLVIVSVIALIQVATANDPASTSFKNSACFT